MIKIFFQKIIDENPIRINLNITETRVYDLKIYKY